MFFFFLRKGFYTSVMFPFEFFVIDKKKQMHVFHMIIVSLLSNTINQNYIKFIALFMISSL